MHRIGFSRAVVFFLRISSAHAPQAGSAPYPMYRVPFPRSAVTHLFDHVGMVVVSCFLRVRLLSRAVSVLWAGAFLLGPLLVPLQAAAVVDDYIPSLPASLQSTGDLDSTLDPRNVAITPTDYLHSYNDRVAECYTLGGTASVTDKTHDEIGQALEP